jgi:hypothetical protein
MKVAKECGADYSLGFLRALRSTSAQFPPASRLACSWHCHWIALDPETLRKMADEWEKTGRPLEAMTISFVREQKASLHDQA